MYKVEGEPDLRRDSTGVIHNVNNHSYLEYITKRNAALENRKRIEQLESDNKEIKETLKLILQLLRDDCK